MPLTYTTDAVTPLQQPPLKRASRSIYHRFMLGCLEALRGSFWSHVGYFWVHLSCCPSCLHIAFKMLQDVPRWPNLPQNDEKYSQNGPLRRSKIIKNQWHSCVFVTFSFFQHDAQNLLQDVPKRSTWANMFPKWSNMSPTWAQDEPKMSPRWV